MGKRGHSEEEILRVLREAGSRSPYALHIQRNTVRSQIETKHRELAMNPRALSNEHNLGFYAEAPESSFAPLPESQHFP